MKCVKLGTMFFNRSFTGAALALSFLALGAHAQSASNPALNNLFKGQKVVAKQGGARLSLPAQSQLARKGAFATISASDPSVKHALPATNLAAAKGKLNQNAQFSGTVAKVYIGKGNARVLLDFAANYKTAVIGLVDAKNFAQFPDLRALSGKRVLVSGRVISFKDQTQIDLRTPSSIRVVR